MTTGQAPDWSTRAAAAAREVLSGPGAITDRVVLLDAIPAPGGVLLTFRWRRDPTVYGYLIDDRPLTSWSHGPSAALVGVGESAQEAAREWAQDLRWRLKEQLETGGVRWAPRLTRSEPVMLDLDRPPAERDRYYVGRVRTEPIDPGAHVIVKGGGSVQDFDPALAGRWLSEAGLHVDRARSSLLAGRLLCWLQAYTNEARPTLVAHAAASWADDRSAVLDTLEALPGLADRSALLTRLLWVIAYEATEQGAYRLDLRAAPPRLVEALRLPGEQDGYLLTLPVPTDIDPRFSGENGLPDE